MKKLAMLLAVALLLGGTFSAEAAEFYVHKETGKNSSDGSKENPFKNLQKAIDVAADGDTIYVAAGNYCGLMDKGQIKLTKQLTILGGYSPDFSSRDMILYAAQSFQSKNLIPTVKVQCSILSKATRKVLLLSTALFSTRGKQTTTTLLMASLKAWIPACC